MLDTTDKLPKKITNLIYVDRGLNTTEINYIKNMLTIEALRLFINLRYTPDPIRYDNMKMNDLLDELKCDR
jgi:hypothetical protein